MRAALTFLAWVAVLMVGTVTAAANFRYGWLVGHGEERWIYAVGGTVLDVVKTFLPLMLGTFLAGALTVGTFFRQVAGWTFWVVGVAWSLTCALGLYAITKEANVGDTLGKQATYRQLTADQTRKQGELNALVGVRNVEVIEGELASAKRNRLWDRTIQCTSATAGESREFCAKIDTLAAEKAASRPAHEVQADRDRLSGELRDISTKLAGIDMATVMQKADPATEALAKLLGWDVDTVKTRLALMIALLFEFTGLLPWIIHGSHGAAPARPEDQDEPIAPAARSRAPKPATTGEAIAAQPQTPVDIPEVDSLAAMWIKSAAIMVKRKGSYVPAGEMFDTFAAWCRAHGHGVPTQTKFGKMMTDLGFTRKKISGSQRYVDVALTADGPKLSVVGGKDTGGAGAV
jgi:hypothetical protein